jgi:hypothetical protein
MTSRATISPQEAADRLEIRELIDAYARCAGTMMIASIRYLDDFVKQEGQWLFAERRLMVNWTETRPSAA